MEEAGKVAIGRFVLKEYLVAVRPTEHGLMLQTLFYADEVRDPKKVWVPSTEELSEGS
jgi:DNA end-binding protein Ku